MFMHLQHATLTLCDDPYGTRVSDNQLKTISNRKADKEGHWADALADPFSRLRLYVSFRRRGQSQTSFVHELVSVVLKGKGSQSNLEIIVTTFWGYGNFMLPRSFPAKDISSLFVMPEHLLRCHPFVGKSFLQVGRLDDEEEEEEEGMEKEISGQGAGGQMMTILRLATQHRTLCHRLLTR